MYNGGVVVYVRLMLLAYKPTSTGAGVGYPAMNQCPRPWHRRSVHWLEIDRVIKGNHTNGQIGRHTNSAPLEQ
jgi:hypothetical protein